jgi:hypothetical protein
MATTTLDKANYITGKAKELASTVHSWTEFSNKMFDQEQGLVAKVFGRMPERKVFYDMPQYEEVNRIFLDLIKRFGVSDGAAPKKSGKFVVRVPKTVHSVLEVEAKTEGISLNQLALSKLSIPLKNSTNERELLIAEAFRKVYNGWSTDRVVIDPKLDAQFLKECRKIGLTQNDYELNHQLFDIRKSGKVSLPPATRRSQFRDYDQFEFASEIAFRFLQRRDCVSLDRILCDPEFRNQFDDYAKRLCPDISVLHLRAGALNLRKSHRLRPTDSKGPIYTLISAGKVEKMDLSKLPTDPAAYVFYEGSRPLFAGETVNLQSRIKRHMLTSEHKGLPIWLEEIIATDPLDLRYAVLPAVVLTNRLSWLRNFINKEHPILNYQKAA